VKAQFVASIHAALLRMEWRFHRVSDGPDEYICPDGCKVPLIGGKQPLFYEHHKSCVYEAVLITLAEELKPQEPAILLKDIL